MWPFAAGRGLLGGTNANMGEFYMNMLINNVYHAWLDANGAPPSDGSWEEGAESLVWRTKSKFLEDLAEQLWEHAIRIDTEN